MIHLSPLPQADLAFPLASSGPQEDAIDAANPLVLPADWRAGPRASADFSGSVSAEARSHSAGIAAIAEERRRQVEQFGHTPEEDRALRPRVLPDRAVRALTGAIEDLQFRGQDHRARARRHLAQAGALCAAAIDWLDARGGQ